MLLKNLLTLFYHSFAEISSCIRDQETKDVVFLKLTDEGKSHHERLGVVEVGFLNLWDLKTGDEDLWSGSKEGFVR